jgi:hypothetical protein
MKLPATPEDEHAFYARPENQQPQGPARRRRAALTAMVPVRFAPEQLAEIQRAAEADDRSVSSWIRRAATQQLKGIEGTSGLKG